MKMMETQVLAQGPSTAVKETWGLNWVTSYPQQKQGPGVRRALPVVKKKVNCMAMIIVF